MRVRAALPLPSLLLFGGALALSCASDRGATEGTAKEAPPLRGTKPSGKGHGQTLTLERVFSDPPLAGRPPLRTALSPSGKVLTFLRPSEADSEVTDLWALFLDEPDAKPRPLVRAKDLVDPERVQLSEEERMALERRRLGHKGIVSWSFCGEDGVLFPLSGDLYSTSVRASEEERPSIQRLTDDGLAKLDPRCSPKGRYAAYVKEGDLYLLDVESRKERRLTTGASPTVRFGVAEFIAQEEMGRYHGYWFSPDERYLAYTKVDESSVSVKVRPFLFADRAEMFEQRYPGAGETNAEVTLHVRDLETGEDVAVKTPELDGYLPRMGFFPDGRLFVQWQSRDQRRLILFAGAAPAFELTTLLEEEDEAWVELHDDLHALSDGRLLWSSERSGRRQLYLLPKEGGALTPLTDLKEPVGALCSVDERAGLVFFTAARSLGKEQHLYAVPLSGGEARQVTREPGWHHLTCGGSTLIDSHSRLDQPPVVRLIDEDGAVRRVLADNPAEELRAYLAPKRHWLSLTASDGTPLNALLLMPPHDEGERLPLLVYTYGGPTTNIVADRWGRQYPLFLSFTQRGFAVLLVDNRGTAYRDRAFTRAFKDRFGVIEIEDQKHAVREVLKQQPVLDEERVGIFGWSYGGYVSVMALLDEDSPFRAGAAVAPVTDWALYDTHYTERYIGTPEENAAVYERANAIPRARNLLLGERALLLAHGMADDNVLFTHTLKLASALQEEGAVFRLMPYPGHAHGIRGQRAQLHVWRTIARFFDDELKRPGPGAPKG